MDVQISQVRLMFSLDTITDCVVASNWLYIVVGAAVVVRINLDSPGKVDNIQIPAKLAASSGSIARIVVDQSGNSMLAITSKLEYFFYSEWSHKQEFNPVSKLKGTNSVSASFHPTKKGLFFLGTKDGSIIEVSIDINASDHYFKRDAKHINRIWKGHGNNESVQSIIFRNSGREVLVAYGTQILKWQQSENESSLEKILSTKPKILYSNPFEQVVTEFIESPDHLTLAVILSPQHIGFLRGGSNSTAEMEICEVENPKFLLLSNYHLIVITNDSVQIVDLLSNRVQHTLPLPDSKSIKGVTLDYLHKTFWMFNNAELFEIKLENEMAGMWKMLAHQNRFDEALEVCDSREAKSFVLEQYGNYELEKSEDPQAAAKYFGLSDGPFETLMLKIMDTRDVKAVQILLKSRLSHTNSKFQQILLTTLLADFGDYDEIVKYAFDAATIQQIMMKRGDFQVFVDFSITIGDYESAVQYYISNCMWSTALELIRQHGLDNKEIVYRYASILLKSLPKETVESWMRLSNLDVSKLLPYLIAYSAAYRGPNSENQALRYLKHLIYYEGNKDEAVFETILSILCVQQNEVELLNFLKEQAADNYDNDFALRLTLQFKQYKCAVYLYTLMGLYEEAVMLCLEIGGDDMFNMSVEIADKQVAASNEELRKHLLRVISKYAIDKKGPKAALQFIHLLRIGDLLVQFPEFESLDELAPEVVNSLEHTKNRLLSINSEIDDSLNASEEIQQEISNFKKQSVLIEPGEPCQSCLYPLATRQFSMFPCQHGFHSDCLQKQMHKLFKYGDEATNECAICCDENIKEIDKPLKAEF